MDGSPALVLTFSQPLDPKRDYQKLIQVFQMPEKMAGANGDEKKLEKVGMGKDSEPISIAGGQAVNGAWVVGDNPRLLYFPHIKPQTRYVVQVSDALTSASMKKLASESRFSILTAEISPAYYFASNGMVLPAKQNGGLPVVTVNVPEVDVQFMRVRPDQLPRFLDMVIAERRKTAQSAQSADSDNEDGDQERGDDDSEPELRSRTLRGLLSRWELDSLHKLSDSVYQGRFLTEQKTNKQSVTFLPVEDVKELKEPGIYIAIMSQPGRFGSEYQTTYFYVSDIGLSLRMFPASADALVSSLSNGKAISGVQISWVDRQGKVLAHGETDGDGRANFSTIPTEAKIVLARKGEHLSMLALKEPALDLSEYSIGGNAYKATRLFAYSGRNLYRPGEAFDMSVLARDADGKAIASQPIQAILRRPDGNKQFLSNWKPDPAYLGYYRQRLELPPDAPTGTWQLEVRHDPAEKQASSVYSFAVEEFMPERMKLDLSSPQALLNVKQNFNVEVQGNYLYGAPASGNKLLGVIEYARNLNPFDKKFPGFVFGNEQDEKLKKREQIEEQFLDGKGHARINIDTDAALTAHSPIRIYATLSLLETGGRPVIRSIERTVWPGDTLIGVRPKFNGTYANADSLTEFEVVRVNRLGNPVPGKGLQVRLYREDRDYYWRFDDQHGWHSGYTDGNELIHTFTFDTEANGKSQLKLPVKYGRYRVEITDPASPALASYHFYAGWNAQQSEQQGNRPDLVTLKLDKPMYRDGDTVRLSIHSPHKGQAIVSIEGDKMLMMKRLSIGDEEETINLKLDPSWRRQDMYVNVMVLRTGDDRVTPARALGLIHLPLDRSDRKFDVQIDAPEKVRPETTVKIKVKVPAARGKNAMVTVSAVDTGILNITNFISPDPYAYFFGQLRYGADLHDIYGRLIEKMAGKKGTLKFGGDASTMVPTKGLPQKVKLLDLFSGPVALNANGEADIALPLPDFNGKLRLMAVVSSADRFGSAEREMTVAAPLIVELATPRFVNLGDSATLALDLHNMSGSNQQLKIRLSGERGLQLQEAERELSLANQGKTTLRFRLTASGAPQLNTIRVQVAGQNLSVDRQFKLQVEAPTAPQNITALHIVDPGASVQLKTAAESSEWYPGSESAEIMITDRTPLDIRSAISDLLVYPYGCTEQTISTSYPHVFIDEQTARRYGLKPFSREQRLAIIEKSIARLATRQAPNGGFSLWGDASAYEYWLSAYTTRFLQDARSNGFEVPDAMYRKASEFLSKQLPVGIASLHIKQPVNDAGQRWEKIWAGRNNSFSGLTHGAYVLAQDRQAPLASLRQLYEVRANATSGLSLIELGIALQLMGDTARSKTAIAEGIDKPRNNSAWSHDYGSDLRDAALSYALLLKHKPDAPNASRLVGRIAALMKEGRGLSTQDQLALFLAARGMEATPASSWSAQLDAGGKIRELKGNGHLYPGITYAELNGGIQINNTSPSRLYVQVRNSGYPKKNPPAGGDIKLTRRYFGSDGTPLGDRQLKVGDTVWVRLTASSAYDATNTMLVDRIPAGLEIENTKLIQGELGTTLSIDGMSPHEAMSDSRILHTEFRDNRFVAAVRLGTWWNNAITLFYRARVVTPGRFVLPPVYAEDMYAPQLRGVGGEASVIEILPSVADKARPLISKDGA
ncbi:alpha-2-macroglobulin [Herbaspirillum sp. RTI4]|uniref:alpha-2-macroglobulin n=1 Tax=Herbaspirillum sp. RTI4 TaxID=3048640 RepID=UPI002AB4C056|nr:alpha-2-macroglobulin [Herbaspirillum sp. RTI4]MDY7579022.1 alpha-2-macroglobulin [Herbaspirillum sp. RTI4]